jgi:VanZ family protein
VTRILGLWGPPAAWAALVFAVSSFPVRVPGGGVAGLDKVAHFGIYAVLGLLLARAVGRAAWPAVALGWAYGASDEVHQMFVPGRSPEVADWLADAAGVLLGVFLFHRWAARRAGRVTAAAGAGVPAQ